MVHGRDDAAAGRDVTVHPACLCTLLPLVVGDERRGSPEAMLSSVREQYEKFGHLASAHGVLRHMDPESQWDDRPDLYFNFQPGGREGNTHDFDVSWPSPPQNRRFFGVGLLVWADAGKLDVMLAWNRLVQDSATMDRLMKAFSAACTELLA
jgi:hypothetical protein